MLGTTLYDKLGNEEDARACADIPDEACREAPRNFALILATLCLTKVGDAIASPKTVLTWVMATVGAPVALVGLLVPIRESGSLIPQLVIASWVRKRAVRKWVWVLGALIQGAAVLGIALVTVSLSGAAAGAALLGLLSAFSLARGLSSVAAKDVLGKTIPKQRRGRLTGFAASAAGVVSIGIGVVLLMPRIGTLGPALFGVLLAAAGLLWVIAALVFSRVEEYAGETAGGRNALGEAFQRLALLGTDAPFRRFVLARALALCSALSAPYYIWLARDLGTESAALLGLFVRRGGRVRRGAVLGPVRRPLEPARARGGRGRERRDRLPRRGHGLARAGARGVAGIHARGLLRARDHAQRCPRRAQDVRRRSRERQSAHRLRLGLELRHRHRAARGRRDGDGHAVDRRAARRAVALDLRVRRGRDGPAAAGRRMSHNFRVQVIDTPSPRGDSLSAGRGRAR